MDNKSFVIKEFLSHCYSAISGFNDLESITCSKRVAESIKSEINKTHKDLSKFLSSHGNNNVDGQALIRDLLYLIRLQNKDVRIKLISKLALQLSMISESYYYKVELKELSASLNPMNCSPSRVKHTYSEEQTRYSFRQYDVRRGGHL
ncbi:hypothetical protein CS022_13085 [Veronia nyctiphanis]|uniref:Uncharacterized protein n=1 Tax=Veronia nyctiphanis TaxID=1278244 RepID=A0A4Q0YQF0_9GAMM|nr:hypothetical protein CS022_13085 [Veronia nyctiphanis]